MDRAPAPSPDANIGANPALAHDHPHVRRLRPFRPDALTLARLAEDLSCPDFTLRELAQRYDTSLEQLSLFLLTEPALAHVAAIEAANAIRIRLAAASHLDRAVNTIITMLDGDNVDADKLLSDTPRNRALRETQRANARRAAHLLYRLAHYRPLAAHLAPRETLHAHDESASRGVKQPTVPLRPAPATPPAPPSLPAPAEGHAAPPQPLPTRAPAPSGTTFEGSAQKVVQTSKRALAPRSHPITLPTLRTQLTRAP